MTMISLQQRFAAVALIAGTAMLAGCGSGDDNSTDVTPVPTPAPTPTPAPAPTGPTATSVSAATATATSNANCTAVSPFYWEIGDVSGKIAGASVGGSSAPTATSVLEIASASKWLYGAYVVEKKGGVLSSSADIPFLNFTSGYTNFAVPTCPDTTVADCLAVPNLVTGGTFGTQVTADVGKFDYNSGHLQVHAANNGLGADNDAELANDMLKVLAPNAEFTFTFYQPQLAGGGATSATNYATFLRKMLNGASAPYKMATMMSADAVCTNPGTCSTSIYAPVDSLADGTPVSSESWHYSLAHWIEDDPTVGDGSFSSPGAFGFYPWVDKTQTYYGVLSREDQSSGAYFNSVKCGRLIRKAFVTGVQQTGNNPT